MTAAAAVLFVLSAALAVWSYLVYPPLLRRLAARAPGLPARPATSVPPSVDVLVSAADEEAVIAARVRDLLEQEAPGTYRIVVGCDGSADRTAQRAREVADSRVAVREFPSRRGKASVVNDLAAESRADVLVFTDANTRFEPGAVRELCGALERTGAGAACGRLALDPPGSGAGTPESLFWDRETALKEAEGRLGVCLGANGAIYAARREDVVPLPPDTTSMDDFLIPLGIARRGHAVVFAPLAVAREASARDAGAEAARRFRIGIGAGQVLRRERWLWNARRHPRLAFVFFSRKAARWLAPGVLLLSAALALGSPALRLAGAATLLAAALVAGSAPRGWPARGALGRLYYFAVINLWLTAGVAAGLLGYSRPVWKPVARS